MEPFVLTHRLPLPTDVPELPEHHYDTHRQVNVTADGTPLTEVVDMFGPTYTHNSSGHKKDDD